MAPARIPPKAPDKTAAEILDSESLGLLIFLVSRRQNEWNLRCEPCLQRADNKAKCNEVLIGDGSSHGTCGNASQNCDCPEEDGKLGR